MVEEGFVLKPTILSALAGLSALAFGAVLFVAGAGDAKAQTNTPLTAPLISGADMTVSPSDGEVEEVRHRRGRGYRRGGRNRGDIRRHRGGRQVHRNRGGRQVYRHRGGRHAYRSHRRHRGHRRNRRHRHGHGADFALSLLFAAPYLYSRRSYSGGGSCDYWSDRCISNWGYGNSNYYGCLRYHGCY